MRLAGEEASVDAVRFGKTFLQRLQQPPRRRLLRWDVRTACGGETCGVPVKEKCYPLRVCCRARRKRGLCDSNTKLSHERAFRSALLRPKQATGTCPERAEMSRPRQPQAAWYTCNGLALVRQERREASSAVFALPNRYQDMPSTPLVYPSRVLGSSAVTKWAGSLVERSHGGRHDGVQRHFPVTPFLHEGKARRRPRRHFAGHDQTVQHEVAARISKCRTLAWSRGQPLLRAPSLPAESSPKSANCLRVSLRRFQKRLTQAGEQAYL